MAKMQLEIGESMRKCNIVAKVDIVTKATHRQEVYGIDTFDFNVFCGCDDRFTAQIMNIQKRRFARVVRYERYKDQYNQTKTRKVTLFEGYIDQVQPCTKPKKFTYKVRLANYKNILQHAQLTSQIKDSYEVLVNGQIEIQTYQLGQFFTSSTADYTSIPDQMRSCGVPFSFCVSDFFANDVELDAGCGDSVYDVIENLSKQINAIWYIEPVCTNGNVRIDLYFTDCLGEDRTNDPNSVLYFNGKFGKRNTISNFCAPQIGGGVNCVTVRSTYEEIVETEPGTFETVEREASATKSKSTDGFPNCIELQNPKNKLFDNTNFQTYLDNYAQEKLDQLCEVKVRYDLDIGKERIGAQIGDIVKLKIQQSKPNIDTGKDGVEVTVLKKTTVYQNCVGICKVTVGSPEVGFVSREQIRRSLGGLIG